MKMLRAEPMLKRSRLIFIFFLLAVNFVIVDFPGSKILLYFLAGILIFAKIYSDHVKKHLHAKRFMETERIFSGLSENTSLVVSNDSLLPVSSLHLIDYGDLNISVEASHHFILSFGRKESDVLIYPLFGRKRGKYTVGPTRIEFTGPFGIHHYKSEIDTRKEVVIFPNIFDVNNMNFKSMQPYGEIKNKMPIFEDPTKMVGLREYQIGDEIRWINWKVSARQDKMMVNTYQPSISSGTMILLNLRDEDYNFRNRDYHMERAIEIAASLVREFFLWRQEVGLSSNCKFDKIDTALHTVVTRGEAHFTSILSNLALVEGTPDMPLEILLDKSMLNLSWGTSLYVITPTLSETELYKLIHFYQSGHSVTIINLGPEIKKNLSLWDLGFQSYYAEFRGNIINLMRM